VSTIKVSRYFQLLRTLVKRRSSYALWKDEQGMRYLGKHVDRVVLMSPSVLV
jgi:hypothetical protein